MSSLPDRTRPRLTQPARGLARTAARALERGAWRLLHPRSRASFLESARPAPLERLYYETRDGWRAPLLRVPVRPGARGEPVLLAHGLGASPEALRYGEDDGVAGALRDAGFAVFLWSHRGDGDAIPPRPAARGEVAFDQIVSCDLSAAVDRIRAATSAKRVFLAGHGLGGQAALCFAAGASDALAGVVAVAAPMRFSAASGALRLGRALALLPAAWRVPLRAAGRAATPWLGDDEAGRVSGERARGLLAYGTDDLPVGLLREILGWHDQGGPTSGSVDWREALAAATAPLLVVCGAEDRICPPESARAALERWAGPAELLQVEGLDHQGLWHGDDARDLVLAPSIAWLLEHRESCWLDASTDATLGSWGATG